MHESKKHQHRPRDLDPIQRSRREGPTLDSTWLISKLPLTNAQRLGFIVLSAFLGVCGCRIIIGGIQVMNDSMIGGVLMTIAGLVALYLALRGLWRVARDVFFRKPRKSEAPENPDS